MVDERKILRGIGLSEGEADVYLALLEMGPELASKVAGAVRKNRSLTYAFLNRLMGRGLASYVVRENRKYFNAADPEKIFDVLKEKEKEIQKEAEDIRKVIPELRALRSPGKKAPVVEVYVGREGYKTIMEDMLRVGKCYCVIGYGAMGHKLSPIYEAHWHRRRVKMKIKRRLLARNELRGTSHVRGKYTEVKYLPKEYGGTSYTIVYGNRSVIFLPIKDDFMAILIDSRDIADSYRSTFNLMWNSL